MTATPADPVVTTVPAAIASGVSTWPRLVDAMAGCPACPLSLSRTRVVTGVFPAGARVLLVGEAPGAAEDAGGLPFVGRSGQLLDTLLAAAGLARAGLAVCNVVKCRPPANRPPRAVEVRTCRPWLDRQVGLIDPAVVVTLGATALAWALGRSARLAQAHGLPHDFGERVLVPTYHPAAALRFGPRGAPMAALRADLGTVASLLSERL
ncbi:MAG: uracil-DNA glycosylase [Nocardioidaceae bacterium]